MADTVSELVVRITGDASDLEGTINDVSESLSNLERQQSQSSSSIHQNSERTNQNWQATGENIKKVGESIDTITKPIQYAAVGLAAGGVAAVKFAMDFEDSFSGVEKTVEGTPEQIDKIKQSIIDMSTVGLNGKSAIPLTTTELNELAAAGGQLGIQTDNIADFTEVMAQMGTATNLVGEQGASTIARFLNVMDIGQGEIRNVGSAIVDLGNNSATTEAEIAAMALRMGKTGKTVRMSGADVLGYSAALSSLGVEAELGGSAVGRTWLAIETAVAQGGAELEAFAKYSGKSAEEFRQQWNSDSKGAFNGLLQGLTTAENLTLALDELGINNTQDLQVMQALVNGYDLVTESVERANTAYSENTALQEEFDKKSQTTASQLQITKNNVVEAARGIGETLLPTVKDVSGGVAEFAQKLAGMNDEEKKAVVNSGLTVIALGAVSKGVVGTVKGVGGIVEAVGNLKGAFSAGGVLAKFAPTLSGIASAAGPAALAVAGIATAVVVGKKAYDAWYDSQYRWSEGLSEGNDKVRQSIDEYKQIRDIQDKIKTLKLIIENPESSKEQVNDAKLKLEEIKDLLSEEYNLVINSDNTDLEDTVDNLTERSKNELQRNLNAQQVELNSKSEEAQEYRDTRAKLEFDLKEADDMYTKYDGINTALETLGANYTTGMITQKEYTDGMVDLGKQLGYTEDDIRNMNVLMSDLQLQASTQKEAWQATYDTRKTNLDNLKNTYDEYQRISGEMAGWYAELIGMSAKDGNAEEVQANLEQMSLLIKNADLDMNSYAQSAALAMNGVDNLSTAWQQAANGDGRALDGIVKDYIRSMQEFGATSKETAVGASLIKNGFVSIQEAASKGKLDVVVQQANEIAHSMELIPEDKRIDISAAGDISLIDDATGKVQEIQRADGTVIRISAEGNVEVIDKAGNQMAYLESIGAVTLRINAETGDIEALDEAGNVVANLSEQGDQNVNVNVTATTTEAKATISDLNNEKVEVPVNADATNAQTSINALNGQTVTVNVTYKPTNSPLPKAKGTQNFEGGLAMVNDERGISDPRELIVDKGHAFIPEGRDVILPLSKGAKVYTASQTKAIMSGIGIPRYAEGKNNSDAFTEARDNWNHYKNTHAVTTSQELEKWVEFSEQFKDNIKDVWDIEEKIFSLTQKRNQELNEQSKAYIVERSALNDWNDVGDSPIDAFNRVKERNLAEVEAGRQTWEEYNKTMSDIGSSMYDDRISQSEKWLEHEEKYNGLTAADYIAGLERMKAYTEEYYANGLISYQEYAEGMQEINDDIADKTQEMNAAEFSAWQKDADTWQKMRNTYGDWDEYGDSEEAFIKRKLQRIQEFYDAGKISFADYIDYTNEYSMELYNAQTSLYEDMLQKQQEYISSAREELSAQEKELQDSWTVADRQMDMADVQSQLDIYAGAVTDRGQEKYKELQEQMKQLQRDEELHQLQVKNNAVIEGLEEDYKILEENKKAILENMRNANINIEGYVDTISTNIDETGGQVVNLLENILSTFGNLKVENTTNYNDMKNIVNNISQLSPEEMLDVLNALVGL